MRTLQLTTGLLLLAIALQGCSHGGGVRQPSEVIAAERSPIGRSVQAQSAEHGGRSGLRVLSNSVEAFQARAELVRQAKTSLDLQYYIVHDGLSTRALLDEVLNAADRGVRVRILLDDTTSDGLDDTIAALVVHPNIQIRLFNPLRLGRSSGVTRAMGRLFDVSQQHRRMHNKLWLADNSLAIVGGRNLGDEYFDAEPDLNFTDIDLLGIGPVAAQLGSGFDQYWNSALSRPIGELMTFPPGPAQLLETRKAVHDYLAQAHRDKSALYRRLMSYQDHPQLDAWREQMTWAPAQALWDAPSKILERGDPDPHLLLTTQLAPHLQGVQSELMPVSAYFVPGQTGLTYLTGRADAGVAVNLLTNSLEATDVPAVHGGYAPYRKALLRHGVKLFEMRRQAEDGSQPGLSFSGGSESSLHSKAMVFDRKQVFIGSFNFDPRSVLWNTEVGVLVDNPQLAEQVRALALQGMSPAESYEARLQDGQLHWVTEDNGRLHSLDREPGDWWRRFNAWFSETVGLERLL